MDLPKQVSLRPLLAVAEATSSAIALYLASLTEVLVETGSGLAVKNIQHSEAEQNTVSCHHCTVGIVA